MNVQVSPSALTGTVPIIPSKSDVHRLLLCAAQADAPVAIELNSDLPLSEDILATLNVLPGLGADVELRPGKIVVTPGEAPEESPLFDCNESGSTLRFLLPVAAAHCAEPSFTGRGRLPERPIGELLTAMKTNGVSTTSDKLPLTLNGTLKSGVYELPGNVSSQYITGLLLALPTLDGDSEIRLTTPLQSASYINITLHALSRFAIRTSVLPRGYVVPGGQTFQSPGTLAADGDWSNAAFFFAAGAIGETPLSVSGLAPDSPQGDKSIVGILNNKFGSKITKVPAENGTYTYTITPPEKALKGCIIDLTDIPDTFPILAMTACFAEGRTTFVGGERLRIKESDRIAAVHAMITALGGTADETPDGLVVHGKDETGGLTGGTVNACNDHRIVMAAAIAATRCSEPVTINGAEAVNKSYPSFFDELEKLGGNVHVI